MNLIQIQDKLKSLPNDPRVMQMLTSYANGQNPQVPPYLALGELNRRKGMLEQAQKEQAGQPPSGTIKDQIEQQTGIMAQRQQQMQAAQGQAMNAAQVAPAQGIAQGVAQPQGMASGGLASLRPSRFRSGGVIAFQEAGSVDDAINNEAEDSFGMDSEGIGGGNEPGAKESNDLGGDPRAILARLMKEAAARRTQKAPEFETPLAARKRMIAENPEAFGILAKPVGEDAVARLDEMQKAKRDELARQKEELAGAKPGILQLLGQAAMGTRGQYGKSALASILGGYSELSGKSDARQLEQEQALRMQELSLQQAKADALNKVDEIKRARAENDITGEQNAKIALAKIARDHNVSLDKLLGSQLSTAAKLVETDRKSATDAAKLDAQMKIAGDRIKAQLAIGFRPSEKERILGKLDSLRRKGDTEGVEQLLQDVRNMQGGAAGVGQAKSDRVNITEQLRNQRLDLKNAESPEEEAAIKEEIERLKKQLKEIGPKDTSENAEPKPITGQQFDAKWKTLKKGQTLVGPDGKTYTKG